MSRFSGYDRRAVAPTTRRTGAASLDRRVRLERSVVELDDHGGEVRTWGEIATVWAAHKPVSDGEKWRAGEIAAELTARFLIRWSEDVADLSPVDRLVFEDRVYSILGVKEVGRREGVEITAGARAE